MNAPKPAILSLDQGTTSTRAIVFDVQGNIIASHAIEHEQHYPAPNHVEHNAEEIWQNALAVCKHALSQAENKGYRAETMGITNQRETCVAWSKDTGMPLAPALVWQDKRTADLCADLNAKHGTDVKAKTGLPIDAYFSATKMAWLLENNDAVKQAQRSNNLCIGTIESYLIYRLTSGNTYATDATNASRTLLFNIQDMAWDNELSSLFKVPVNILPEVKNNIDDFGRTDEALCGFSLSIQGSCGDQQSATVGQACFEAGMAKNTYGTGNFLMMNIGAEPKSAPEGILTTVLYKTDTETIYAYEGSSMVCGSAIQWLRDRLSLISHATETEELAASAKQNDEVYVVPGFVGLGAPHWQAGTKGHIVGLTLDSTKADIVRATLDGLCYQTLDLLTAMETPLTELRIDGGMVANTWFCDRLADITDVETVRPKVTETTALGAAYLAAIGAGLIPDFETISNQWQVSKTFTPSLDSDKRSKMIKGWQKAIQNCIDL
ncbi:MAG: glycerol kinase GlpK [Pseudomonadota bacterium]|nr:glycerol kinase GlpK [Pseudomonadota bacterium]